ncbi:MAG TPA: hypothetical protein VFR31_10825 [Thermoanaerobaculia bacterium]|nr:hypothetical protein [Thermoanaerobaculia bacterium]
MRKLLILLILPMALQAQQAPKEDPYLKRFQELDQDKNGYITPGEWPLEEESFVKVDRNNDGQLAQAELLTPNRFQRDYDPPPPPPRPERLAPAPLPDPESLWGPHATIRDVRILRNLDRDLDNRLTHREWTGSSARFHRLDTNQDGVLSPRELSRN